MCSNRLKTSLILAGIAASFVHTSSPSTADCVGVKLFAKDNEPGKTFGFSTAAGADYIAFGAPGDDEHGSLAGAVYVINDQNGSLVHHVKLTATDAGPNDLFGSALAASGDVLLIGAERDSDIASPGGSAYVFRRAGSTWSQEAKLTPPDGVAQDRFGSMVALAGDVAAVTAIDHDAGANGAGAVYIFLRSGSSWTFSSKLIDPEPVVGGRFGHTVGVFGDWVVVGSNTTDRVRVHRRNGAEWPLETTLTAVNPPPGETGFGSGLAVASDFLAISAIHLNLHQGVVYLFKLVGGSWVFQERKDSPDGIPLGHFGWSIGMTETHLAVGAEVTRKLFLYRRLGDEWRYESAVRSLDPSMDDGFGSVVAIGPNFATTGAYADPSEPEGAGAGYAFALSECTTAIPAMGTYGLLAMTLSIVGAGAWIARRNGRDSNCL